MTVKRIVLVAAFAAAGLVLAFVGLEAAQSPASRHMGDMYAESGHQGHGGWMHGRRGFSHLCSEHRDKRIGRAVSFVEAFVDFTPEQDQAWERLTAAVRESSAAIGETCSQLTDGDGPADLPQRLARLETMMTVGLEVIHTVRPAFDTFYATLDERQKQAIDQLMSHRRGQ